MERGKSRPGEKTIVDVLHPAALAAEASAAAGASLGETADAAAGLEAATAMRAQHGRAAYCQEKSIGRQEPGATVGCLLVQCLAAYIRYH